jgi:hypothetical protein
MVQIAKKAELLKPGAYIISFTKRLKSPKLKLLNSKQREMSWGQATIHTHQRIVDPVDVVVDTTAAATATASK